MKLCRICRTEYGEDVDKCSKCGITLEDREAQWTTPEDYGMGY